MIDLNNYKYIVFVKIINAVDNIILLFFSYKIFIVYYLLVNNFY